MDDLTKLPAVDMPDWIEKDLRDMLDELDALPVRIYARGTDDDPATVMIEGQLTMIEDGWLIGHTPTFRVRIDSVYALIYVDPRPAGSRWLESEF